MNIGLQLPTKLGCLFKDKKIMLCYKMVIFMGRIVGMYNIKVTKKLKLDYICAIKLSQ